MSGSNDGTIKYWDLETQKCITTFDLNWKFDKNLIRDIKINYYDLLNGKGENFEIMGSLVGEVQFFQYGMVSASVDGCIRIWDSIIDHLYF